MSNKNIEIMKKVIEEKNKKSAEQGVVSRLGLKAGDSKKPFIKNQKSK